MRVFVSAGEPSGDHHAALLVRAIRERRPDVEFAGLGGPHMEAEGVDLVANMTQFAVMWISRAILNIHRFVDLARRAERNFLDSKPDVCVLVDFPGFHWWLAWRAKRHGIPVVFYCPPQIWAWASWRIGKMRRLVDHVLSALPFEHDWFTAHGVRSTLVGHPFFDDLDTALSPRASSPTATKPLVLLLPGSRGQEIEGVLGSLLRAAAIIRRRLPEARFAIGALHERHACRIEEVLRATAGATGLRLGVTRAPRGPSADRDRVSRERLRLPRAELVSPRPVHHAGQPARLPGADRAGAACARAAAHRAAGRPGGGLSRIPRRG